MLKKTVQNEITIREKGCTCAPGKWQINLFTGFLTCKIRNSTQEIFYMQFKRFRQVPICNNGTNEASKNDKIDPQKWPYCDQIMTIFWKWTKMIILNIF